MIHESLQAFLADGARALGKGPYAIILAEDPVEIGSTIRHALARGFSQILVFGPRHLALDKALPAEVHHIIYDLFPDGAREHAVNAMIDARPGEWMHYCFNAEYLFFPFCETRNVRELVAFSQEERRDTILTYVIDLYAADLDIHPNAVDMENALLDTSGYYALARNDPAADDHPRERQLDFFGGLRWRFEEHVPRARRKIDRVALFLARRGVHLRPDHTFTDEEYNTYACPWHNNITATICSFRTAKALKANPGSTFDISSFRWHNSAPFSWTSRQLMELGLMEPGQWF